MHTVLVTGGGVLLALVLYKIVSSFLAARYHANEAQRLGCKPAFQRPYKWPLGADMAWRLIQADKKKELPTEVMNIYKELGVATWEQNLLGTPNFSTADPKNIQALLATQFNDFAIGEQRRNNFFPMLGNGIFTSDGKAWEHSRAMLRPQFARQQISDLELEEVHVQDMFKHLPTDLSVDGGWTPVVDLSPLFFRLTLDSATEFLFGESVNAQIDALPGSDARLRKAAEAGKLDWTLFAPCFDGATMALGYRARLAELYFLHSPKSFHEQCKQVNNFADYYVNLALKKKLSGSQYDDMEKGQKKKHYVFLDELVQATQDPIELRSQLLNILLAGRDTTAGLLGWTFWNLVRDQARFNKLRQAILESFGPYSENPTNITFETLKACTYLQYTMSETLRIFATVPLNSRRAIKDTTLPRGGGPDGSSPVYVKKGQEVNYSVHIMHRRKDIWGEDAEEFKPERWEGRKPGWEFLPFNGGPRICLGQQFALTEAGYVIVRLLQKYDRIENCDTEVIAKHQYSVTTSPVAVPVRLHEATRN